LCYYKNHFFQPFDADMAAKIVEQVTNPEADPKALASIEPDPNTQLDELGKMLDQLETPMSEDRVTFSLRFRVNQE
jgi:hypothetical protein